MKRVQSILIWSVAIVATVVLASLQARASVVLVERDFCLLHNVETHLESLVLEHEVSESFEAACSLLLIDASIDSDPGSDPPPYQIEKIRSESPAGMSPSPSSLFQVGGAGAGGAAVDTGIECIRRDSLQATLSPESRSVLPAGPVFRWFRPPRV